MKKIIICLLITFFTANTWGASKAIKSFDLMFKGPEGNHRYTLLKQVNNPHYILIFKEGKQVRKRKLNLYQAQGLLQIATQITWSSKYRKPAMQLKEASCHTYALLQSGSTQTKVCTEDTVNTGKTFGLLNQMYRLFN